MDIQDFCAEMERIAPQSLADPEDTGRIGLVVEGSPDVRNVCCAVDVTGKVIREAVARNSTLIVAHHTPLWDPVTALRGSTARMVGQLCAARVNLFVMHTNFDRAERGVNRTLADLLELSEVTELSLGVVGNIRLSLEEIAGRLGGSLFVYGPAPRLQRLAVVGGAGFRPDLIREAMENGAGAFLSSELKHHMAISPPIPLLVSTHYHLEAPGMRRCAREQGWIFIDTAPQCTQIR